MGRGPMPSCRWRPSWSDVSALPASSATKPRQHGRETLESKRLQKDSGSDADGQFLNGCRECSISGQRRRRMGDSLASRAQNVPRKEPSPEPRNNIRNLYAQHRASIRLAYR